MPFGTLVLPVEDLQNLEPDIIGTDQPGRHEVRPEHILFSIAVSQKRIADVLEAWAKNKGVKIS